MKLARRSEAGQQRYAASLTGSKMRSQSSNEEQGSATDYISIKSAVNRFNFIVSYHDVCVWCDDGQTRVSYLHSANRRLAPASAPAHH